MNPAIFRRSISLAFAAAVCAFAVLSVTVPFKSQPDNSSSTTVAASSSDAPPANTPDDGFHW